MKSNTSITMADLDAVSVAPFLRYVETSARLIEVSGEAIFSFRIPSLGLKSLLRRKKTLLCILTNNNRNLCAWMESQDYAKDSTELVLLRSLYVTTRTSIETTRSHIETVKRMMQVEQHHADFGLRPDSGAQDELPF